MDLNTELLFTNTFVLNKFYLLKMYHDEYNTESEILVILSSNI